MTVSFHLCQPGGGASCGACCGLYNFRHHTREAVAGRLAAHTEALRPLPPTLEAYQAAARVLREGEAPALFAAVRVCPLLGFLDEGHSRVGCLGHPKVTGGVDLRDCGAYRAEVCESFTCPSFTWLTDEQARLVQAACADWYLYGLVVTDVDYVRGCLRLLEWEVGGPVGPEVLRGHPEALQAFGRLLGLKETAPGRGEGAPIFGRFAPDAEGEPTLRTLGYEALGTRAAPEDDVVLCLGYAPTHLEALQAARELVRTHVAAVARALQVSKDL